jgi:hypothetical protein
MVPRTSQAGEIQWLRTSENYYLYNEHDDTLAPYFCHYRYDKTARKFFRLPNQHLPTSQGFARMDASVTLEGGGWMAALTSGSEHLELELSLPVNAPRWLAPKTMPKILAGNRREFNYDEKKGYYVLRDLAAERQKEFNERLNAFLGGLGYALGGGSMNVTIRPSLISLKQS